MTENKPTEVREESNKRSAKGDVIVWVVTLAILAVFTLLMFALGRWTKGNREYFATLDVGDGRYGEQRVARLTFENDYAVINNEITWCVDGKEVKKVSYDSAEEFTLDLDGFSVGNHEIEVKVEDTVIAKGSFVQNKPLLTIDLPVLTVTYGEPIGELKATASGWVDGDEKSLTSIDNDFLWKVDFAHQGKVDVGTYPLNFDGYNTEKYEIKVNQGSIEVLPKEITFEHCNFSKVYDGKKSASTHLLKTSGVVAGDLVDVVATAEFEDKNAGNDKKVVLTSCKLVGQDAKNYTVNFEKAEFVGSISPLNVTLKEVKAMDKIYDGTTNVTFADGGKLSGVLAEDSVSVGVIIARFEDAKKGMDKKVIIEKVTLVGADSGNYSVMPTTTTASILGKAPSAVHGNS